MRFIRRWAAREPKSPWGAWGRNLWFHRWRFLMLFTSLLVFVGVSILGSIYGGGLYARIVQMLGIDAFRVLAGLSVYFVALAGAHFKRANQYYYGQVEISIGMSSALAIAHQFPVCDAPGTLWFGLIACVYVVIRGIGNMNDSPAEHRPFKPYPHG